MKNKLHFFQNLNPILITAWITILTLSLFRIISQEVFKISISETTTYLIEVSIVGIGLGLSIILPGIRPLRPFYTLFLVLVGSQWLVHTQIDKLSIFQVWLNNPSFNIYMIAEQSLNLIVTTSIMVFLLILKKKPGTFFLRIGNIQAQTEPVDWLGIKPTETWKAVGSRYALFISLGTLVFLVIAGHPSLQTALRAIPFLPAVLICAAANAFNEEMTYKASFLSVLEDTVGKKQALLLMAAFFGIFHFYGIPYGVIGVLMATFLGWLLGKSMLETRGIFWAWFIHFLQDVLIFAFLAIGSVSPGG